MILVKYYNYNIIKKSLIIIQPNLCDIEESEIYITKNVAVKTIIHSLTPVEYPQTSEEGVAIIYHIEGWDNVEAAFTDVNIYFIF